MFHKAGWVFVNPDTIIENGYIQVESGVIVAIGNGNRYNTEAMIDHGHGVIMPPLVNAHTHLELSALKGKLSYENGFRDWVRQLLREREAMGVDHLKAGAWEGVQELLNTGSKVIGDISTLGITHDLLRRSGMFGIMFKEFLGNRQDIRFDGGDPDERLRESVAGHAIHTTAPDMLVALKQMTRQHRLPFSIHLGESEDEREFITTGKGGWADFLTERGIAFSDWKLPEKSPVRYADRLGILDEHTMAVHLIHAGQEDFEILARYGVQVCLCLRSNWNLHGKLPDIYGMLRRGVHPCLGTDSLASTETLSIFDEMAFMYQQFPNIRPQDILKMATQNGANALGFGHCLGSLEPGKLAEFIYLPVSIKEKASAIERIISTKQ